MPFISIEGEEKGFSLSAKLLGQLDLFLEDIKAHNQDLVVIIDGKEGAAKSTTARMLGWYCAQKLGSKFDRDSAYNIHNEVQDYIDASLDSPQYTVHIMDESRKSANKYRTTSTEGQKLANYLSECREDRNQVHIICVNAYHDLAPYLAKWRASLVLHMEKKVVPKKEGGFEFELGHYRLFGNNSFLKYAYDFTKYQYPKWDLDKDRIHYNPLKSEVLSEKGLLALKEQKKSKMREKYHSESEVQEVFDKAQAKEEARRKKGKEDLRKAYLRLKANGLLEGHSRTKISALLGVDRNTIISWETKKEVETAVV